MLDHLDLLDDATPPEADTEMLTRVHGRANRLRQRVRLATATAIVIPLVIIGGAAAIAHRHATNVEVITPSTRPTTPTNTTSEASAGTLPNGLHIEMTVETPTVQLGDDITAKVVLSNDTNTTKTIGSGNLQCALGIGPALKDASGDFPAESLQAGQSCLRVNAFPPGTKTTFTTLLPTKQVTLKKGARREHFSMTLMSPPISFQRVDTPFTLQPVPVEIVAPALTAQIELSSATVVGGNSINGFVVFRNAGRSAISAGCSTHRDYQMALAADSVVIRDPRALQLNPSAPCLRRELLLPPGTTRFPFKVPATYFGCSPGFSNIPGIPSCIGHLKTPPLPAGRYEIVFTGVAAVGAVDVAPAPVQVLVPHR